MRANFRLICAIAILAHTTWAAPLQFQYPPAHPASPIIPLVGGSWYESQVYDFNVTIDHLDPTKLQMFASGMAAPVQTGVESIGLFTANASDPFTWTNQGTVLTVGTGWESGATGLRIGSLVYDSGTYYMYYNADFSTPAAKIGVATSTNNGLTWTRYSGNPILTGAGQGRNDGSDWVSQPTVIKEGSAWTMIYSYRSATEILPGFRYATSSDGFSWTKGGSGDILTTSPLLAEFHQVLKLDDGRYYLIYEAGEYFTSVPPYKSFVADSDVVTGPYRNARPFFFPSGVASSFDQYHVATPFLFNTGTDWILYYCGGGDHLTPVGTNHWPGGATTMIVREVYADAGYVSAPRGSPSPTPTATPSTLPTGLVAYWKLDEASGTRVDSKGTNDLTDNNTVTSATGVINNGASFAKVNSEYLSHASNATLQMGSNTDWTITAWVKLASLPATSTSYSLVTKDDDAANSRDYTVDYNTGGSPTTGFRVYIKGGGTYMANTNIAASTGVWYFLVAWYDSSNGQLHLRINDTTTYDATNTGATGTDVSAAQFRIGAREYNAVEDYADAMIDEVGIWKRLLTTTEKTLLYNGGSGLPYGSF